MRVAVKERDLVGGFHAGDGGGDALEADQFAHEATPGLLVVTSCRLPNRALAEVSERVRKTLSRPSMALKKGTVELVEARARPRMVVAPK